MKIAVPRETGPGETRVALTPQAAGQLIADGVEVLVQAGAGEASSNLDDAYRFAGWTRTPSAGGTRAGTGKTARIKISSPIRAVASPGADITSVQTA